MFDSVLKNPWIQAAGALLALLGVCFLAYLLTPVLIPLCLAFFVAYILDPVVDVFERRGIRRSISTSALAVLGLVALVAIPLALIPSIIHQADQLGRAAASVASSTSDGRVAEWVERSLHVLRVEELLQYLGWVPSDAQDVNILAVLVTHLVAYAQANAADIFRRLSENLSVATRAAGYTMAAGFTVAHAVRGAGRILVDAVVFLANFAVFAFVAGYLLNDFDGIVRSIGGLVPRRLRKDTFRLIGEVDDQLKSFLRGQLAVCLCLGTMYGIGMLISGVPFAIPIALFGTIAAFIPYLGIVITMGIAIMLTWVQHGLDWHLVGVLVTFGIAQMLEGNVLTPRIVGEKVGLHPVWVILAVLVFGQALGFLGLLLAVPIAAVLKVFVVEGVTRYKRSHVFREETPST